MRLPIAITLVLLAPIAAASGLLSDDVRTSWTAARELVEKPSKDSKAVRDALAAVVEAAGLPLEVPKRLEVEERGPFIDRIRQAVLLARLKARKVAVPDGMVAVPGGLVPHPITKQEVLVPDFFLARREVSRAGFAAFLKAAGYKGEGKGFLEGWTGGTPPAGTSKVPVVHVSRADTEAFANRRKARLPTAEEWLLARGGCGRVPYPWGKRSRPGLANVFDAKGLRRLAPVDGPTAGATPLGILRMAGNASEWTGSPWGDAEGQGAAAGESFVTVPGFSAGLVRRTKVTARRRDLGFRCAASIPGR